MHIHNVDVFEFYLHGWELYSPFILNKQWGLTFHSSFYMRFTSNLYYSSQEFSKLVLNNYELWFTTMKEKASKLSWRWKYLVFLKHVICRLVMCDLIYDPYILKIIFVIYKLIRHTVSFLLTLWIIFRTRIEKESREKTRILFYRCKIDFDLSTLIFKH